MFKQLPTGYFYFDTIHHKWETIENYTYCGLYNVELLTVKGMKKRPKSSITEKIRFNVQGENPSLRISRLLKVEELESFGRLKFPFSNNVFRIHIDNHKKVATILYFVRHRIFIRDFKYKSLVIDKIFLDAKPNIQGVHIWDNNIYYPKNHDNHPPFPCVEYISAIGLHEHSKNILFIDFEGLELAKENFIGHEFQKTFYSKEARKEITFRFEIHDATYMPSSGEYLLIGENFNTGNLHLVELTKEFELDHEWMMQNRVEWLGI